MAPDLKVNIIVLGESGVGKTSILLKFGKDTFKTSLVTTSIDCHFKVITINDVQVQLVLWDTGGQERFRSIVKGYFRKADGVLLVYDVGNAMSFHKLESWLSELRHINEESLVYIVGNKIDLGAIAVTRATVKSYADNEKLQYFEISAKSGENVETMFHQLTKEILEKKNIISPSAWVNPTETPEESLSTSSNNVCKEDTVSNNLQIQPRVTVRPFVFETVQPTIRLQELHIAPRKKKSSCC